jgi:hypothetical protein
MLARFLSIFFLIGLLVGSTVLAPVAVYAAYGTGTYGTCAYGQNCPTPTPTNPVVGTVANVASAIAAGVSTFFCANQAPASAPTLYEIDTTGSTARLWFTPAAGPYDRSYIAYGDGKNSEGYGAELTSARSSGALTYTVTMLKASSVYTFKVRGGNGCKPGAWSSTLTVKTQPAKSKKIAKYYPNHQAVFVAARQPGRVGQVTSTVKSWLPHKPAQRPAVHAAAHPAARPTPQPATSWWSNLINFFTGK